MGRREAAEARGRSAEALAAWWLRAKGYRVLSRRVRLPVGEIDLVARKGDLIAFIEVKERATIDAALGSVTPASWRRISRAAESWMAQRPRYNDCGWRYDLIAIAPGHLPAHLRDAWRPGMA
jgi:putative endonuclease